MYKKIPSSKTRRESCERTLCTKGSRIFGGAGGSRTLVRSDYLAATAPSKPTYSPVKGKGDVISYDIPGKTKRRPTSHKAMQGNFAFLALLRVKLREGSFCQQKLVELTGLEPAFEMVAFSALHLDVRLPAP